ncbi:MAG: DUF302 domain-containing protein [Paracoccus sp. (in: a-proteobacteria)]|nr:DUF302 domain-containing protein [Paracoccus sp. (in: a-proteobacteria)]
MTRFPLLTAALAAFAAGPALAAEDDITRVASTYSVTETADRLAAAAEENGATAFARVDHGAGARGVGSDIGESELLIFGNPQAGTPVMVENRLAGLMLPLKVLVYEDAEGQVWLAYEDLADRLDDLDGVNDATAAPLMGALRNLTEGAAN